MDDKVYANCLLCGASELSFVELPYIGKTIFAPHGNLSLAECNQCGFVRNIAYNRESCAEFYGKNESGYIGSEQFSSNVPALIEKHERHLRFIANFYSTGVWWDLGCCDGALQICARRTSLQDTTKTELHSLDFSVSHLKDIGERYSIAFHEGSIESLDIDTRADLYSMMHVLEHVNDPVNLLRRLRVSATSHTTLIMEVPDRGGYGNDRIYWYSLVEHINHFSLQNLVSLCSLAGWELVSAERYTGITVGLSYPAVICAFKPRLEVSAGEQSETNDSSKLLTRDLDLLSQSVNKVIERQRVCFWGRSKLFNLIAPNLVGDYSVYDVSTDHSRDASLNSRFVSSPPTPSDYDCIIISAFSSYYSIAKIAESLEWQPSQLINIMRIAALAE